MAHAVVIGGGLSGLGAVILLKKVSRRKIVVADRAKVKPEIAKRLLALGCSIEAPSEDLAILNDADLVVFSPTVSSDNLILQNARARGLRCISEVDLGLSHFGGTVIAVTGTNGKSTITSMIEHILTSAGNSAKACGNIGTTVSEAVAGPVEFKYLVVELSSYQLELSSGMRPLVSVFSSFSHDHLERHKSMQRYFEAKWRLMTSTVPVGLAVMTAEVAQYASRFGCHRIQAPQYIVSDEPSVTGLWKETVVAPTFTEMKNSKMSGPSPPSLILSHDRLNAAIASIAASFATGMSRHSCAAFLKSFQPLPHRCQILGKARGYAVINDSKSTNVEATLVALTSVDGPVVLFLGGKGKGESYKAVKKFSTKIKHVIAFGASKNEIVTDLEGAGLEVSCFDTLKDALDSFITAPIVGATILFSPACASFDEFRDFEHRGLFFSEKIGVLLDEAK